MTTVVAAVSLLLLLGCCNVVDAATGCREAQMCCKSKDNTCRVTGQRMHSHRKTLPSSVSRTCFCDAGCLELGDCCADYKNHCTVVDCELSKTWSSWGECSVLCGLGVKERHRRVLRHPQNGGRSCRASDTVQRTVCEGVTCKLPRAISPAVIELLREMGRIIPLSYASWRRSKTYSPYTGIRKHLFQDSRPLDSHSSCAIYEITSTRSPCDRPTSGSSWITMLKTGNEVCVECQAPTSLSSSSHRDSCRGRGVYNRETRWMAMTSSRCHGTWVMKTPWNRCSCTANGRNVAPAFVFV